MPPKTNRKNHVEINREEYEALCYLRDITHAATVGELQVVKHRLAGCEAINREQLDRLNRQDLALTHARAEVVALTERLQKAEAAIAARAPVTSSVEQPLFATTPMGRR
jgi:hypothetical protein